MSQGQYHRNIKNDQITFSNYPQLSKAFSEPTFQTNTNNNSLPVQQQYATNFQEQMSWNLQKMHPSAFAYQFPRQMLMKQLQQDSLDTSLNDDNKNNNLLLHSNENINLNFGLPQQHQQLYNTNNNNQYSQYLHYNSQQPNMMQYIQGMSTPSSAKFSSQLMPTATVNGNYHRLSNNNSSPHNLFKYQSPISYMTPPSSFNHTPQVQHHMKKTNVNNSSEDKIFNSFTAFGTPGGYPYYPPQQQQNQHQLQQHL